MTGGGGPFLFMLRYKPGMDIRISTVSLKGVPVEPDPRCYRGDKGALLKSLANIRRESRFRISWGDAGEESAVSLTEHPYLMYQLVRCDNLCDGRLNSLRVSDSMVRTVLRITRPDDGDSLVPGWRFASGYDADTTEAAESDSPEDLRRMPLTDEYVLVGDTIHPMEPLGENYMNLSFFASPFPADMLEKYLSVVYSYVDNFALDFDGMPVVRSTDEIVPEPTLVFEKVDPDLALHVRVTCSTEGVDDEFLRRFELNCLALRGVDGNLTVRLLRRFDTGKYVDEIKDLIARSASNRKDAKDVFVDGDTFIIPSYVAGPFLLRALPQLLTDYKILGTDKLKEYKIAPVKPRLSMKFSSGIDFLEGSATVEVAGREMTLGELFEQYRRDRYVTLGDGTRAVIDSGYMKRLQRLFGDKHTAGRNVRVGYFDLPDIEELLSQRLDPKVFERQREVYEGFNHLGEEPLDIPALNAVLRHYQTAGVKWLRYLHTHSLGGCLADDMGLGKTIQTIAMLSTIYPSEARPSLIVMPRSLLFNWEEEIARFNPSLSVYTYYRTDRDLGEAMKHDIILTTYAMVRNDIEKFKEEKFHYIILDESQNIKNIEAQTTRAIYMLDGAHRLALSGTPLENNLTELFSLFRFLNPGMLGDLDDFNRRYATPIMRDGDKEATASLRRRIYPFMLRRLKKDVLTELPDRVEQTLYVEMSLQQAEFYEQRRKFYYDKVNSAIAAEGINKSRFVMFQALTELRRIASVPESLTDGRVASPKLEELTSHLVDAVANGHKCVVFYNYIAGLELTGERLAALGIKYEVMTGATTNRAKVVEHFNTDPACKVLLMTLKTGGVGLNLTVADTVFIFEPWWNKAAEQQAINRLHRIGQTAKVHSYSLIARDTIEEKILRLQEQKSQLFDDLISADPASSKLLTQEDINFILG